MRGNNSSKQMYSVRLDTVRSPSDGGEAGELRSSAGADQKDQV